MRVPEPHRPTFPRLALFGAAGILAGALYGVFFGAMASIFEGGPTAAEGIRESWWWFATFGGVSGIVIAFERDTLPRLALRKNQ